VKEYFVQVRREDFFYSNSIARFKSIKTFIPLPVGREGLGVGK